MKKSLFMLIAPLMLVSLASCQPENIPSIPGFNDSTTNVPTTTEGQPNTSDVPSTDTSTPEVNTEDDAPTYDEDGVNIQIYYFISASNCNKQDAYYKCKIGVGRRLPKVEDPKPFTEAFNKFIGWSTKPYAMTDEDLWDFDKDHLPKYIQGLQFRLYGQWDYVETAQ